MAADPVRPHSSSVRRALQDARAEGRCALIPYLTLGYPSLEGSIHVLRTLESLGVDAVEIGIPFSDPVADGPTIQRTMDRALREGTTLRRALAALAAQTGPSGPRVLFSYWNPLLTFGPSSLPEAMRAAGCGAALVTDLIVDEATDWMQICQEGSVETCFLVTVTSDRERIARAAKASTGFVYAVSTLGVTGARKGLDARARETVLRLREESEVPVAVGFGIARPEDVVEVGRFADGAVVGSAFLDALGDASTAADLERNTRDFIGPLLEAARS